MAESEKETSADRIETDRKPADAGSPADSESREARPRRKAQSTGKTASRRNASAGSQTGKKAGSSSGKASGKTPAEGSAASPGTKTGTRTKRRSGRAVKGNRQPITESFSHAFDGIMIGTGERNMRIHLGAALLVVIFGLLLQISVTEWCLCFILFGLIMGLELVNTAIEAVVDLVTEEYRPLAKRAKDAAAGAVLIAAIMAAVTGLIIFIPRILFVLRIT